MIDLLLLVLFVLSLLTVGCGKKKNQPSREKPRDSSKHPHTPMTSSEMERYSEGYPEGYSKRHRRRERPRPSDTETPPEKLRSPPKERSSERTPTSSRKKKRSRKRKRSKKRSRPKIRTLPTRRRLATRGNKKVYIFKRPKGSRDYSSKTGSLGDVSSYRSKSQAEGGNYCQQMQPQPAQSVHVVVKIDANEEVQETAEEGGQVNGSYEQGITGPKQKMAFKKSMTFPNSSKEKKVVIRK